MEPIDMDTVAQPLPPAVVATLVPDVAARLRCLPERFGAHCTMVEYTIYHMLRTLCSGYDGAFWLVYTLSNGGCYTAPVLAMPLTLECPNSTTVTVSADTAGVIACAYAFSHLAFRPGGLACARAYDQLYAYIGGHADAAQIRAATD